MEEQMPEKEVTRNYELALLLAPHLQTEEAVAHFSSLKDMIAERGGSVSFEGSPNRITLAYPIKKQMGAYFGYIQFTADSSMVDGLKDALRLDTNVIRFMIIHRRTPFQKPTRKARKAQQRPHAKTESAPPEKSSRLDNEELERKLEEILQ